MNNLNKLILNLEFNNFRFTEKGDLRDIVNSLNTNSTVDRNSNETEDVPELD